MQDNLEKDKLTPFPNLFSRREVIPQLKPAHIQIFSECNLPDELILISWAVLLNSYTSHETLRFFSNGEIVAVESSTWTPKRQQAFAEHPRAESTAVWFQRDVTGARNHSGNSKNYHRSVENTPSSTSSRSESPSSNDSILISSSSSSQSSGTDIEPEAPALSLVYDTDHGNAFLQSSGLAVPAEHLPELRKQLLHAIWWATRFKGLVQRLQFDDEPRLSILNSSPSFTNGPQLLHELVHREDEGSAIAIDYLQRDGQKCRISYIELHHRANVLAAKLSRLFQDRGVSKHGKIIVPVLLEQSPELYITLLAVLESGAAFCPLSFDMPQDRIKFIIEDVSADVIITTAAHSSKIPASLSQAIFIVDDAVESTIEADIVSFKRISSDDLAYVMYSKYSSALQGLQMR